MEAHLNFSREGRAVVPPLPDRPLQTNKRSPDEHAPL